ncbi:hypothetical protein WN944_023031 [Citrus x changshan-huyou]|uniref:Integrase catalytic domain-containing protein n=1 Tax=Citrus x changshan-huyou TaxID=2935761 RepID=A0AAP0N543_9ROSI
MLPAEESEQSSCKRAVHSLILAKPYLEKNLAMSTYDKEMLAIVFAVQKWHPYLMGQHFKILTDHRSLKKGAENSVADALSRRFEDSHFHAISSPIFSHLTNIEQEYKADPALSLLIDRLQSSQSVLNYSYDGSILRYKGRIILPSSSVKCQHILHEFHASPIGGHSGFLRTYKRLKASFYWKRLKRATKLFIAECDVCQRNNAETVHPSGLLQPLPIPDQIWEDISMDFIDGLPPSNGKTSIFVVVDRLSKYAHFSALSHPYTAALVAKIFVRDVAKLHGMPRTIVSDRDPIFLSQFWEEFFQLQGSSLCRSSAYHPQTDGQTEVVNRSLEGYLRCFAGHQPSTWTNWLPWAEWWYNTTFHSAIQMTPFEAIYGRAPPRIESYLPGTTNVHAVDLALCDRDLILRLLKDNLEAAQSRMKFFADKKRTERVFAAGDWILSRIGTVAYKLDLPATSKVHPFFHVSCLKRKLGVHTPSQQLPDSPYVVAWEWQPLAILDRGIFKRNNRPVTKLLVQWQGQSKDEATWEECSEFAARFPSFQLADKLPS